MDSPYKGSGSITKEQFLFRETRIVAKLMIDEKLSDVDIIKKVYQENLFQYPTNRMIESIVKVCIKRLKLLEDKHVTNIIAHASLDDARQMCLYIMMKQYRLIWDYMITVIGRKYEELDFSYGRTDLDVFFTQIKEQDERVKSWSISTLDKIKNVINRILVENGYIDNPKSKKLNSVIIRKDVENIIRSKGDIVALSAFNCFF